MQNACGQQKLYELSGTVKDSLLSDPLFSANLYIKENQKSFTTDTLGNFLVTLQEGTYTLVFQYAGYKDKEIKINLHNNVALVIQAETEVSTQQEVIVVAPGQEGNIKNAEMGKIALDIENIKLLPALMGEVDLLKAIQLLPGVQASGEGNTGIYVRGGGPDQNLILLDDAVVYNTGHLFGFFSVFNADAIQGVNLYKGNMPSYFGGRISSVVDFSMKEGDKEKYQIQGGIGLIASRLSIEGPIVKKKSSFIISGRRTYIDQLTKPLFSKNGLRGVPYYFYDVNLKANYDISNTNKISLSLYNGRDEVRLKLLDGRLDSQIGWGNTTATFKWNLVYNSKLSANTFLIYNSYGFSSIAKFDNFDTKVESNIYDFSLKHYYDWYPTIRHSIKYGFQYTFHTFIPRRTDASASGTLFNKVDRPEKYAHDLALYFSDDFDLTDRIKILAGVRLNIFQQVGPYLYYSKKDTIRYKKLQPVKTFINPEPRIGIRYSLNASSSLKAAFNINNQYIHLVSLSGNALPFDIWVPSSRIVLPQKGWQYSVGYFKNLKQNHFEFSLELYYKKLNNLIEYRQDYVPAISGELENEFVFGQGYAYGAEFFLKKKFGKLQGWIGYTLSKAYRKFPEINEGKEFPARYDRRHDVSIVGTWELNKHWTFGGTFVFATGQAITIPERRYFVEGSIYNQYGPRNGFRMQPYNRLDLSATYQKRKNTKRFQSTWTFAIYNVYNRKNPYLYFIDTSGDVTQGVLNVQAKKLYLFPILPSVTWNFKY